MRAMNQKWKERMQNIFQNWKNDSGIIHAIKMLAFCIVTIIAYVVIGRLQLGTPGLILRGICVGILIYILYQVNKSE